MSSVPMSEVGLTAWIGSFLLVAVTAFGFLPFITLFTVVPILAIAGVYDSWRSPRNIGVNRNRWGKRFGDPRSGTPPASPGRGTKDSSLSTPNHTGLDN